MIARSSDVFLGTHTHFALAGYSDVFLGIHTQMHMIYIHVYIGCFSSGYTRLVMEIAAAERGVVLPHVSMDISWTF